MTPNYFKLYPLCSLQFDDPFFFPISSVIKLKQLEEKY